MKKIICLCFSALLLIYAFSSCVKPEQLIGSTWVSGSTTLTFTSSFALTIRNANEAYNATFSINGGRITITCEGKAVSGSISGKQMKFDALDAIAGGLSMFGNALGGGSVDISPTQAYISGKTFKRQ